MKAFLLLLSIKLLVFFPMGQQPDSAERAKMSRANAARVRANGKPAKDKGGMNGGLLYRIPLSI